MKVKIKGSSAEISLTKSQFIGSGGEGSIYSQKGTVFKIYSNPKQVIPASKIQELSAIRDPNVIKPQKVIVNMRGEPIGYTMKKVPKGYVLCQLFPKAFRNREGLNNDMVLKLVLRLRQMVESTHSEDILMVDMNEMNFLVSKNLKEIYGIDVDSYQTPHFPATALMESVRDRHNKKFSKLTDWFSFGIISFQMFVGIHVYKGNHSSIRYPQDKERELNERMTQNIPVFHKDVKYPKNVMPFDVIPQAYRDWYKAVFYEGKRVAPPIDAVEVILIPVIIKEIASSKDFEITELLSCPSDIIGVFSHEGTRVAITKSQEVFVNSHMAAKVGYKHVGIVPDNGNIICGGIEDGQVRLYNTQNKSLVLCLVKADEMMSYDGRMFARSQDTLSEISFIQMGKNTQAAHATIANVLENATQMYEGTLIQDMLGRHIASVFPTNGTHYQIPLPEMDGYKIIDAKYDTKVLMVIGTKKGKYDKFVFKMDDNFGSYSVRQEKDITYCGINFVVLENGTVAHINESEELELFHNRKDSTTVKRIDSDTISGDMKLYKDGVKVLFTKNNKLYWLKMK